LALAREATLNGDIIEAENCYQHAEHYFRLIRERWNQGLHSFDLYSLRPKRDGLADLPRSHGGSRSEHATQTPPYSGYPSSSEFSCQPVVTAGRIVLGLHFWSDLFGFVVAGVDTSNREEDARSCEMLSPQECPAKSSMML